MDGVEGIICSSPVGSVIEVVSELQSYDSSVVELPLESVQLMSFRLESAQRPKSNALFTQESFIVDVIDSETSGGSDEFYCIAREKDVVSVPFKGSVSVHDGVGYEAKVVHLEKEIEEVSDSEDENENDFSIIEIIKTSYLQVRSSQQESHVEETQTETQNETQLTTKDFDQFKDDLPELPDAVPEPIIHSDGEIPLHGLSSPELRSSLPYEEAPENLKEASENLPEAPEIPNSSQPDGPFTQLNVNELRQKIIQYGLKPSKSKKKMIQSLSQIHVQLSQSTRDLLSQSQNIKQSQTLIMADIFNKMNKELTEDLRFKVATFQPIHKSDVAYLTNDEGILKNWCDWNSISLIEDTNYELCY